MNFITLPPFKYKVKANRNEQMLIINTHTHRYKIVFIKNYKPILPSFGHWTRDLTRKLKTSAIRSPNLLLPSQIR